MKCAHSRVEFKGNGGFIYCCKCGAVRNRKNEYINFSAVRVGCKCALCRSNRKTLSRHDRKLLKEMEYAG